MAVFTLPPQFGFSLTLKIEHTRNVSVNDIDFTVAKLDEPSIEFSFASALLTETEKDYARSFFLGRNGSQDSFLFEDPLDFLATSTVYDTGLGITTQGVVLEDNGSFFLAKAYTIENTPSSSTIYRPITRPQNPITVKDNLGNTVAVTINYNTGEITSGGTANLFWEGKFYVPVRFLSDKLPITITSYPDPDDVNDTHRYSIPDLRFIEVKESPYAINQLLDTSYNHYFSLPFEVDVNIDNTSKTDIYTTESNFETRESLNSYRYEISQSNQLLIAKDRTSYAQKEYLIGLYRVCLGNLLPFKINNSSIGFDENFRFEGDIGFEMTAYDIYEELPYNAFYSVSNLTLKQYNGQTFFYCYCWNIDKNDGTTISVTNHNRPIVIDSVTYYPQSAIASASFTNTAELNIDATEAVGIFQDAFITEEDLLGGRYDNQAVEGFIADWQAQTNIKTFFNGTVGGYDIAYLGAKGKTFKIECLSLTEKFNRNLPRLTSTLCPYRFTEQGYGKCNVTITTAIQENTVVVSSSGDVVTTDQSTTGYEGGMLEFTSGALIGKKIPIVDTDGNNVTLLYPPDLIPDIGDNLQITRRCGKTIGDCNAYNNAVNFGGQPLTPTSDQKIAGTNDV